MSPAVDFAVLVSLPEKVLGSARRVAEEKGYAAIPIDDVGRIAERLEEMRDGAPVPVLVFAAGRMMGGDSLRVSWVARYVGHTPAGEDPPPDRIAGEEEKGDAEEEEEEAQNPVHWHLTELRELAPGDEIPIASLESHAQRGIYRRNTEPRRPALVAIPTGLERIQGQAD